MRALFKKKHHDGDSAESAEQRFARNSSEWQLMGRPGNAANQQPPSPPSGYNSNDALRPEYARTGTNASAEARVADALPVDAPTNGAYEARPETVDSTAGDGVPGRDGAAQGGGKKKAGFLQRLAQKNSSSTSHASPAPSFLRRDHPAAVERKIGWFCATGNDDWSRVLELCDEISRSEADSKEAARALRKEIKYGTPETQERALRLTAIMVWNSSDRFRLQIASKRFLEVVEEVARNPRTDMRVRQMLMKAFCALAYDFRNDGDLALITQTYNRIKPPGSRVNGEPLDENDHTFDPTTFGHPSHGDYPGPFPRSQRNGGPHEYRPLRSRWEPIPPEAMAAPPQRDLMAEAEMARNNAKVLVETLAFTSPGELEGNELIQEFYGKCLQSQNQLMDDIPWATAQAEQSRQTQPSALSQDPSAPPVPNSTRPLSPSNPYASIVQGQQDPPQTADPPQAEQTPQEVLLASLLAAQSALVDAFAQHEELERLARNEREMAEAQERSKFETRFDRTKAYMREDGEWEEDPRRTSRWLGVEGGPMASGSRSPSPNAEARPSGSASGSPPAGSTEVGEEEDKASASMPLPAKSTNPFARHTASDASRPLSQRDSRSTFEDGRAEGYEVEDVYDAYGGFEEDGRDHRRPLTEDPESISNQPSRQATTRSVDQSTPPETSPIASNNPFAAAMQASRHPTPVRQAPPQPAETLSSNSIPRVSESPVPSPSLAQARSHFGGSDIPRSGTVDSIISDPIEPSAKALGKLRRFSGMSGEDDIERARQEEARLRERYRHHQ